MSGITYPLVHEQISCLDPTRFGIIRTTARGSVRSSLAYQVSGVKLWGYLVSLSQRVNPSHTFLLSFLVGRDKLSTPLGWRRRNFCGGRLLPRGGSTSVRAPENCRDHYDVRLTPESVTVGVRTRKSPGGHVLHSVLTSPISSPSW